jgi:pentatricopeptide repeat protein
VKKARSRILELADAGEPERALSWCAELHANGVDIDTYAYTAVLNAYRQKHDADGVMHVLATMAARGVPASDVTSLLAFRVLRDARRASSILEAVRLIEKSGGSIGLRSWSNALSCLAEKMRSLPHHHELVEEYTSAGWEVLSRMLHMRRHQRPNAYVFNSWMATYASRGDWGGALAVFGAMVAGARVQPDVVSYNILLECLARRFAQAKQSVERSACLKLERALLESMRAHGIEPDARTLSAQLRLVNDDPQAIRAIERRALWYGVRIDSFYVNALIDAYARLGDAPAAAAVLERLTAHRDHCRAAEMQGLLTTETAACPSALPPITSYTLNGVLKACARSGDAERAWKLLQEMDTRYGVPPDAISFTCAITAAAKSYATEIARKLYSLALERLPNTANVRLATATILAEHDDTEQAIRVFERLLRDSERHQRSAASSGCLGATTAVDFRTPVQALVRVCGRVRAPARAREVILAVKRRRLCLIDPSYYRSFMKGVQESQERRQTLGIRDLAPLSPLSAPSLYLLKLECTAPGDTVDA